MAIPWAALISPVTTIISSWMEKRQAKVQSELRINEAVTEAKIERLKTAQASDIAWETTSLAQAGIKDEIMMFVILTPMVACFIPGGAEIVKEGFQAMNESLPMYWEAAFMVVLGASFGVRKFIDFMTWKKGA